MDQDRRNEYRVEYPRQGRPTLHVEGSVLEVIDVSESGIRALTHGFAARRDDPIAGTLRFPDGAEVEVSGFVFRVGEQHLIARLVEQRVPYRRIVEEQRRLLRRYRR